MTVIDVLPQQSMLWMLCSPASDVKQNHSLNVIIMIIVMYTSVFIYAQQSKAQSQTVL